MHCYADLCLVVDKLQSSSGYDLRPAQLRKAPRLFPGMIPSCQIGPWKSPQPINVQPDYPEFSPSNFDSDRHEDAASGGSVSVPDVPQNFRTAPNSFGLLHAYHCSATLLSPIAVGLWAINTSLPTRVDCRYVDRVKHIIHPFQNITSFQFAHWFYTGGSNDAQAAANRLLGSVIGAPDFDAQHLHGVMIHNINSILDCIDHPKAQEPAGDSWRTSTVTITVPSGQPSGGRLVTSATLGIQTTRKPVLVYHSRYWGCNIGVCLMLFVLDFPTRHDPKDSYICHIKYIRSNLAPKISEFDMTCIHATLGSKSMNEFRNSWLKATALIPCVTMNVRWLH